MTQIQHTFLSGLATLCAATGLLFSPATHAQTAEKLHPTANLSYKVAGVRYHPQKNVEGFTQTGRASWYGAELHGRRTSSGERFDMNQLTAAHRTLPIPSYARVTNLSNGRSVVVRINDRGPFHGNRVMDVSQAAAKQLGFMQSGTANIRIDALNASDAKAAQAMVADGKASHQANDARIFVNVKTFAQEADARAFMRVAAQHLAKHDAPQRAIMVKQNAEYVVRIGPFREQKHADEAHQRLKQDVI